MRIQTDRSSAAYRRQALKLMLVAALVGVGLIGRLAYVQLIAGPELRDASERNFVRSRRIPAERGTIFDRRGVPLAIHQSTFDLVAIPSQIENVDVLIEELRKRVELEELDWLRLKERLVGARGMWRHRPVRVARDISRKQVSELESLRAVLDGISIRTRYQREYPLGTVGAHLLGYLGKPTAKELRQNAARYTPNTMIGRFGLERRYQEFLTGKDGVERFAVNAQGAREAGHWVDRAMRDVAVRVEPARGGDLHLTVDSRLQSILDRSLRRHQSGAAIAMDVETGAILGLVSKPSYDPNQWSGRLTRAAKEAIDTNPYHPMLDKSVHAYFPGSVYKIVTAFAAMERGLLTPSTLIESPGAYEFGQRTFHCHKRSGHGRIDLEHALAASADVYFYKLGEELGIDVLAEYGRRFGFGQRPGLGINGEAAGIVPTRAHHDLKTKGGFQHGLALSTAVGQGDVKASIIQVAVAYAAVANGGRLVRPHVVDPAKTPGTKPDAAHLSEKLPELGGSPEFLDAIRQGLLRTVQDEKIGTGYRAQVAGVTVAGKTGTAQVRKLLRGRHRQAVAHFRHRDHAWFAGYAPFDDPQIVVVVLLDNGGSGGRQAAPVFGEILRRFHSEISPLRVRTRPADTDIPVTP